MHRESSSSSYAAANKARCTYAKLNVSFGGAPNFRSWREAVDEFMTGE
jgi:hypothetical protein